jgi:hypothetical protein
VWFTLCIGPESLAAMLTRNRHRRASGMRSNIALKDCGNVAAFTQPTHYI